MIREKERPEDPTSSSAVSKSTLGLHFPGWEKNFTSCMQLAAAAAAAAHHQCIDCLNYPAHFADPFCHQTSLHLGPIGTSLGTRSIYVIYDASFLVLAVSHTDYDLAALHQKPFTEDSEPVRFA